MALSGIFCRIFPRLLADARKFHAQCVRKTRCCRHISTSFLKSNRISWSSRATYSVWRVEPSVFSPAEMSWLAAPCARFTMPCSKLDMHPPDGRFERFNSLVERRRHRDNSDFASLPFELPQIGRRHGFIHLVGRQQTRFFQQSRII